MHLRLANIQRLYPFNIPSAANDYFINRMMKFERKDFFSGFSSELNTKKKKQRKIEEESLQLEKFMELP